MSEKIGLVAFCLRRRWLPARFRSRLIWRCSRLVGSMRIDAPRPPVGLALPEVTIEPGDKIQSITGRIGFEFQGMMSLGVFDDLPVRRPRLLKVFERPCIIDDPVLAGQHQQGRLPNMGRRPPDPPIDEEAGRE